MQAWIAALFDFFRQWSLIQIEKTHLNILQMIYIDVCLFETVLNSKFFSFLAYFNVLLHMIWNLQNWKKFKTFEGNYLKNASGTTIKPIQLFLKRSKDFDGKSFEKATKRNNFESFLLVIGFHLQTQTCAGIILF